MRLEGLISWAASYLFIWQGCSTALTGPGAASLRPPPLSSESFSLCHPLCNQTQFSRKLSSSSNANITAVFSPDIHSRGSMAKVGLQKCAKDEAADSCLLGTYFMNGKSYMFYTHYFNRFSPPSGVITVTAPNLQLWSYKVQRE